MEKFVMWALFDSENGSYTKAIESLNYKIDGVEIDIYPIGISTTNVSDHFINLDLANYKSLFGDNTLFETLDSLPKPHLIIASPPCESWSQASAMENGNACWKTIKDEASFFKNGKVLSYFQIRKKSDYKGTIYKFTKQFYKRINGELCTFNTIEIIERYKPLYYIIENPSNSKMWQYIKRVLDFKLPFLNLVNYNNYDYPLQKPTKFSSNIYLGLNSKRVKPKLQWKEFSKDYAERSNIPQKLVIEIFSKVIQDYKNNYLTIGEDDV